MAPNYWILKNALDYTSPKLVVVDCFDVLNAAKRSYFLSFIHLDLDAFPLSWNKIRAAADLANTPAEFGELLWDFALYHSRWNELTAEDFHPVAGVEMGSEMLVAVSKPDPIPDVAQERKAELEGPGVAYVHRIVEECRKNNIEVLLTYLPFPSQENSQMEANAVAQLAQECGVEYLNFLQLDVVDYDTDCYDSGSHLNVSGAQKVTSYLGAYIAQRYQLEDHRAQAAYADWHDAYQEYESLRHEVIAEQTEWHNLLMLLQHPSLGAVIRLKEEAVSGMDQTSQKLLRQLGIEAEQTGKDGVWFAEAGRTLWLDFGDALETQAGTLECQKNKKRLTLHLNEAVFETSDTAAAVFVFNSQTGQPIKLFSFEMESEFAMQ